MRVYAVTPNSDGTNKKEKIAGVGIVDEKMILRNIVNILGIELESNLAKIIIKLAAIKIVLPAGCSILSYVAEKRYINIRMYFTVKNLPKIEVIRIDGMKDDPALLKCNIIDAIIACINSMGLSLEGQHGFLGRLEKMKQPFVCY